MDLGLMVPAVVEMKRPSGFDGSENRVSGSIVEALGELLDAYLEARPFLSLSAIGRRSGVSEPTLRRIKNRAFKTAPAPSTVLRFLTYVSGEKKVGQIVEAYPGPIADFIEEHFPNALGIECEYSSELNRELADNNKYLVFKLACNSCGITLDKISRLMGPVGLNAAKELVEAGLLEKNREGLFVSTVEWFCLDPSLFKDKFKFMSQFIRPDSARADGNVHVNLSSSLNEKALEKIVKIQKKSLKQIREVMAATESQGDIPIFLLNAIDRI